MKQESIDMSLFKVKIDAWRGTSKTVPAKRTTLTYLVEAENPDEAEALAMPIASAFTAGYKQRAVEWRATFSADVVTCIGQTNKGIWGKP